jgi:hypothetical protein
MGARLNVPSSFSVDSKTTGVPKYKMLGVTARWLTGPLPAALACSMLVTGPTIGGRHFGARRSIHG